MVNTKLVEILKTFSKDEFKEFEKFIRSPYFNKGRNLVPFYKALKSFHPEFINQNFTSEFIFKKIHPDLKFESKKSENILRVLSSEMLHLCKEFIKQEELKSQEMTNYILKLESLKKRNLDDLFFKQHSEILNECESKINLNSDFFLKYHLIFKTNYSVTGEFSSNINEIASLFNYFLYNSALFFINEKVQERNTNKKRINNFLLTIFKLADLEKFLIIIKEDSMSQKNKDLMTYFTWFYMFSLSPSDEKYLTGFEKIFYNEKKFLDREIKFLGYCAISNYYAYSPNKTKLYEMNKNLLEENMFDPLHFPMPVQVFRGIFSNFINTGKIDEAHEFVEKYQSYLRLETNKSMYNFCIAEIEFRKKNYKIALEYISKIELSVFVLKYDLRNLYLKIYYSLNHLEEAIYLLQSYRKFLSGNKNVSVEMKKDLLNFLNFYEKLFKLKTNKDKSEIRVFKKEFEKLPADFSMPHKSWIKEEINMLLN